MTVQILEVASANMVDAAITQVTLEDLETISWKNRNKGDFENYDWNDLGKRPLDRQRIYKLGKDGELLGLIRFYRCYVTQGIEVQKLEVAPQYRNCSHSFRNVAACLLAFACLRACKSYKGVVLVMPTTKTRPMYIDKYGMTGYDDYFVISNKANSQRLIATYLPGCEL